MSLTPNDNNISATLWASHIEILRVRGVTEEYARRAGIYSIDFTEEKAKFKSRRPYGTLPIHLTPALMVPYPETRDGKAHFRYRADRTEYETDEPIDGVKTGKTETVKVPRWVAEAGKVVPYITRGARAAADDTSIPIAITEAPIKAMALDCHGIAAIGLGGVLAGAHDTEALREHRDLIIHDELRALDWRDRTVYIVFDAGITRNPMVALGAAYAAIAMAREGADVQLVIVPWRTARDSDEPFFLTDQGPDDYIGSLGVEALRERISEAVPAHPRARILEILRGRATKTDKKVAASALLRELPVQAYLRADQACADECGSLLAELGLKRIVKSSIEAIDEEISQSTPSAEGLDAGHHYYLADRLTVDVAGNPEHLVFAESRLWRYTGKIWEHLPDEVVITALGKYAGAIIGESRSGLQPGKAMAESILYIMRAARSKPEFFESATSGVAFANGFLTFGDDGTRALIPHTAAQARRHIYDFDFVEDATPVKYLAFLARLCQGKSEREASDTVAALTQHLGASIAGRATEFQKAIFLLGKGGTGNSTIVQVHSAAMPKGSVSAVMPTDCDDEFYRAQLAGKLLNAIDDLPKNELRDSGRWKTFISGGSITCSEKNKPQFTFLPKAGHLLACNVLPPTTDVTGGFRRRVIVLPFDSVIRESEKNRRLATEIQEELPAIISYAMVALSTAIRHGVTVPASSELIADEWLRTSSPVEMFFEESLIVLSDNDRADETKWAKARNAYQAYVLWAGRAGHKAMSETSFGLAIKTKLGISVQDWTATPFKRSEGRYYPISVKSPDDEGMTKEELDHAMSKPSPDEPSPVSATITLAPIVDTHWKPVDPHNDWRRLLEQI